jgi:hypothetical protein
MSPIVVLLSFVWLRVRRVQVNLQEENAMLIPGSMKTLQKITGALAACLFFGGAAAAQIGPGPFAAFPSQSSTDARFLGFGCAGIATFESPVTLAMAVPADQTGFVLNIFDGDTGQPDSAGKPHWDVGSRQLVYSLYADPLRQGVALPGNLVGSWTGNSLNALSGPQWSASAAKMPDNDWWAVNITTSPQAQAPSGNYFYVLKIGLDGSCAPLEQTEANIKIAASNPMSFLVPRFGLVAALRQTLNDGPIVYPGTFPPPGNDFIHAPTTYDGTFKFFFRIPGAETDLKIYDGDFDHGTSFVAGLPSGTVLSPCLDTNDPDTPFDYNGFPFSVGTITPEGTNTPGSPADDTQLDIFRRGEAGSPGRVGCVRYEVTDPLGQVYRDDNPSGSFEWEQFRIATPNAFDPSNSDYVTSTPNLPPGIWSVKTIGLDLDNLNFFHANACATRTDGGTVSAACPQISPYLLGDTVWLDENGNGVQDADEPGIPGVKINLLNPDSLVTIDTVVTGDSGLPNWVACTLHNTGLDTLGLYCHGADLPGDYLLQIAPENFQPGGALEGLASTTGGESQTDTVTDDNVLTYDFGYQGTGSVGDRLWIDLDANGDQDLGETGINGATVRLLDGSSNVIATTTTNGDGNYLFNHLAPGTYTVSVDDTTLPAGLEPSADFDGIGTAHEATFQLAPGENRTDVDFGYKGTSSVGDRLWNDADGDGVQESGETGINGITVELLNSGGSVIATTTTSSDGNYLFPNLLAGNYSVRVVPSTVPPGFVQTYDRDGIGTPHVAAVTLTAGENQTTVDFGYRTPPPCAAGTFKDTFTSASFSNNDGSLSWTGAWVEYDVAGTGVSSGNVTVGTPVSGYMILRDSPDTGTQPSAARQANLAGFASATLTVDFHIRGVEPDDAAVIEVSKDGGVSYTLLETFTGITGTYISSRTYDISAYKASNTRIRFRISANYGGDDDFFKVDQVRIDGACTPQTGSIGDLLWYDTDGDGVLDSGEPGLGGTTVELLNSGNTVIATTTTNSSGIYTFANLAAGSYTVRVVASTLPVGGLGPTYDLDGTGTTPNTAAVTLTSGQTRTEVDFGYRGTRTLGDLVWNDGDGDGVQDSGEAGINGVTVRLFLGTTEVASTVTAADGKYTFTNLPDTTFTVKIDTATLPAGVTPTYDLDGTGTPNQATVTLTASRTDVDFGYRTPPATCTAGYVQDKFTTQSFSNNDGSLSWSGSWIEYDTAGAGVTAGNVTVGTPVSGYLILRDAPDTGTQPSLARQVNLSSFTSATLNFDYHTRDGVDPDDAAVVEISKDGGATYTVLETFTNITGTVISSRTYDISAYRATNTRIRFRISANYGGDDEYFKIDQVRIDGACTSQTGSIGDRVWKDVDGDGVQDSGEVGISGVSVQLLNSGGTVIATQTTNSSGNYLFSGLAAGTYKVKVVSTTLPSGYAPTYDLDGTGTAHTATVTLSAGQNRTDADFGYRTPPTCTGGYFKDLFNTASFSNNDGTLSWAAAWIESDSAGTGVSSGNVTVGSPYAGYLFLRDYPDTGTQPSAARQANLSGFTSATLSFDFHVRTAVDPDDAVVIEVSKNGGTSYTVLETLSGFTGSYTGSRSYNISSYIASNTRIRFRVSNNYGSSDELFKVDWVRIDASCQ